ncbi:MAG: hypothetical protein WDW36_008252 [Sanguina aurantia]
MPLQDAPLSASSAINLSVKVKEGKAGKKDVEVSVSAAGGAPVKAKYSSSDLRKLSNKEIALADVARISVAHSSFTDFLMKLSHERYSVLAQWPDFTKAYGKDFYYRAHPADLQEFYAAVDDFHRYYDVVTEFDSLSGVASELMPAYRKRRMNVVHPAVGPALSNGVVTQFLLAHAK